MDIKLQFLALKVLAISSILMLVSSSLWIMNFIILIYIYSIAYLIFPIVAIIWLVLEKKKMIGILTTFYVGLKIIWFTIASDFWSDITLGGAIMLPFLSFLPEIFIILTYLFLSFSSSKQINLKKILLYASWILVVLLTTKIDFLIWNKMVTTGISAEWLSLMAIFWSTIWLIYDTIKEKWKYRKVLLFILIFSILIFLYFVILGLLNFWP